MNPGNTSDSNAAVEPTSWMPCFLPFHGGYFFLWFVMMFALFSPSFVLDDGAVARHFNTGLD
ncbi:hypothetical protein, partial [Lacticaseibacillus paracasei]|uniref:hypothetical protein n=1 Tax=Lacticaseibacillus paracasei TaxID=1597 RepID=UPI00195014A5